MYYLWLKLCIKESKSADQILSQLMHDTASQSNHRQDEDHKRSQVRIVKWMESIFVVLIFFVSTTLWSKETAQNKKRCKPEYVKDNKLIFGNVIVTSFVLIFRCLNNIIDFCFTLKYNTTLHNYDTRQCNFPAPKTNCWGKQKLTYKASKDFDNINPEIEGTKLIFLFKKSRFYSSILLTEFIYFIQDHSENHVFWEWTLFEDYYCYYYQYYCCYCYNLTFLRQPYNKQNEDSLKTHVASTAHSLPVEADLLQWMSVLLRKMKFKLL